MLLDSAVPGALLLMAGDSWTFPALYARYWEGRRPDIELRPLYVLDESVLEALALRGAIRPLDELGADLGSLSGPSRPERLLARLVALAPEEHPVQVNEAFLPRPLAEARHAGGLLYGFAAQSGIREESGADRNDLEDLLWNTNIEAVRDDPRTPLDPIGPAVLARRYASRAGYYLEEGASPRALEAYTRASSLATNPWDMVHLLRSEMEQGRGPMDSTDDPLLASAELAFLAGDVDRATEDLGALLRKFPTHPRGLLFSERLYSLGRRAEREGGD
jgi:hypothetical protein